MNLHIDPKIIQNFQKKPLKVYFFESGCEWTKVNIIDDFDRGNLLQVHIGWVEVFYDAKDALHLENGKILLKTSDTEWHGSDDKYIFLSEQIKSRCGCATSFSFENKLINSTKLKMLKKAFKK